MSPAGGVRASVRHRTGFVIGCAGDVPFGYVQRAARARQAGGVADTDGHRPLEDRLGVVEALLAMHDRWADVADPVEGCRDRTRGGAPSTARPDLGALTRS